MKESTEVLLDELLKDYQTPEQIFATLNYFLESLCLFIVQIFLQGSLGEVVRVFFSHATM